MAQLKLWYLNDFSKTQSYYHDLFIKSFEQYDMQKQFYQNTGIYNHNLNIELQDKLKKKQLLNLDINDLQEQVEPNKIQFLVQFMKQFFHKNQILELYWQSPLLQENIQIQQLVQLVQINSPNVNLIKNNLNVVEQNQFTEIQLKQLKIFFGNQSTDTKNNQKPENKNEELEKEFWLFQIGNIFYQQKDFQNALIFYKQCLEQFQNQYIYNPEFLARLHFKIGCSYQQLKQYDNSLKEFNESQLIDPYFYKVYLNKGLIYHQKNEYKQAKLNYKITITLIPFYEKPYLNICNILNIEQQYQEAISIFEKGLPIIKKEFQEKIYNNLGKLYFFQNQNYTAINYCKKVLELNANNYECRYFLSQIYLKQRDYGRSIFHLELLVNLNPDFIKAYKALGEVLISINMDDQGLKFLNTYVQRNSDDWETKIMLGNMYTLLGRKKKAVDIFTEILDHNLSYNDKIEDEKVKKYCILIQNIKSWKKYNQKKLIHQLSQYKQSILWKYFRYDIHLDLLESLNNLHVVNQFQLDGVKDSK